ncbi:MAG: hypothetical protein HC789_03165 [Microcoleus sp. CSU_2_2]|nr:hypothetical protein [Microcoleus sp. SU_5_3]NJS09436.1 hypothetical protein [Microcoleus sp. CSU_2_2]
MRRYEQLSLLLGDLIATHHTNYNGDGKPGFGISRIKETFGCSWDELFELLGDGSFEE